MRCPWCGSPVTVRGSQWECGYCGDSGFLSTQQTQQPSEVTFTLHLTVEDNSTPPEKLYPELCEAAKVLLPDWDDSIAKLTACVVFHEASLALMKDSVTQQARQALNTLCANDPYRLCKPQKLLDAAKAETPLFSDEAALSETKCGTFWQRLIAALPPYYDYDNQPDALDPFFDCVDACFSTFADSDRSRELHNELLSAFEDQHLLLNPGQDPADINPYRDLLAERFPEVAQAWSEEALAELDERDILTHFFKINPTLAVKMWRCLLDADDVDLHDPDTANRLVRLAMAEAWDWRANLTPMLDELERDKRFAKQVMQCAYVGVPQKYIFRACVSEGRAQLLESLLTLLKSSAYPQANWYRSWDSLQETIEKRKGQMQGRTAAPKPGTVDDGRSYRYCQVRFDGISRAYSYLTEDDTIQPGDYVLAPLGQNDYERTGKVERVDVYTAANAPYPPERTKHIICKTDAPPEPKPEQKPVVIPPSAAPKCEPQVVVPPQQPLTSPVIKVSPAPSPQKADPPKRPHNRKVWIAAALLLVVLLATGGTYFYLDIQYDGARTNLIAGEFSAAEERFDRIPSFFRDQEALSQYAQAGVQAQSDAVADLDQAEAILQGLSSTYDGEFTASITARLADVTARRDALLYQQAIDALTAGNDASAQALLSRIRDYQDTPTLSIYATALGLADATQSKTLTKSLTALEQVPADYAGPLAEEIVALRTALPQKIADAEAAEKAAAEEAARKAEEEARAAAQAAAEAEAARQAAQQAQANNRPQSGYNYTGDTGAGSGHSLRDDYDSPEDLYEDGDYEDLDEAWDEWEEGW